MNWRATSESDHAAVCLPLRQLVDRAAGDALDRDVQPLGFVNQPRDFPVDDGAALLPDHQLVDLAAARLERRLDRYYAFENCLFFAHKSVKS